MRVTWYRTASLMLENDKGKKIAVDPYLQYPIKKEKLKQRFLQADRVLITHGHFDHIEDIADIYKDRDVRIYGTKTPLKKIIKRGVKRSGTHPVRPGSKIKFDDMHVTVYQSRHCRFDFPMLAKTMFSRAVWRHPMDALEIVFKHFSFREKGETVFYECEEHGRRLQIMGSMNLDPKIKYPAGADVLILPFQGRSDRDVYARQFIRRLKPKRVYLDHYDSAFPPVSQQIDTRFFCAVVEEEFGIPCEAMIYGERIRV